MMAFANVTQVCHSRDQYFVLLLHAFLLIHIMVITSADMPSSEIFFSNAKGHCDKAYTVFSGDNDQTIQALTTPTIRAQFVSAHGRV